jgi:hypothetical protein
MYVDTPDGKTEQQVRDAVTRGLKGSKTVTVDTVDAQMIEGKRDTD